MKIAMISKEYPPHVYGGAGVHVDYLSRELSRVDSDLDIAVHCFGDQDRNDGHLSVQGVGPILTGDIPVFDHRALVDTLFRDIGFTMAVRSADLLHCHTWYTHLAGCLLKSLLGAPLVLTTHSLEPHRPWKREQLGAGYDVSSWIELTAYQNADGVIAVSQSMKQDVMKLYGVPEEKITVIYNGIDDALYRPSFDSDIVRKYGLDPQKPFVLMVSRIARQKGINHFIEAVRYLQSDVQALLCASSPDTPELLKEVEDQVEAVSRESACKLIWQSESIPVSDLIVLYSHASVFVCPSVYEPFGIINLEAMSCGTPVVASAIGGIPEVVLDGETGFLVNIKPLSDSEIQPANPSEFANNLANSINRLLIDNDLNKRMGYSARKRVEGFFSWKSVARQTFNFYRQVLS